MVQSTSPISEELLQKTLMVFCKKELADKIGQKFTRFSLLNSKFRSYLSVASRKGVNSSKFSPSVAFPLSNEGKTRFRVTKHYQGQKSKNRQMFDKKPIEYLEKMQNRIQELFASAAYYRDLIPLTETEFYQVAILCPTTEDFKEMILKSEKKFSKNYKSQFALLTEK